MGESRSWSDDASFCKKKTMRSSFCITISKNIWCYRIVFFIFHYCFPLKYILLLILTVRDPDNGWRKRKRAGERRWKREWWDRGGCRGGSLILARGIPWWWPGLTHHALGGSESPYCWTWEAARRAKTEGKGLNESKDSNVHLTVKYIFLKGHFLFWFGKSYSYFTSTPWIFIYNNSWHEFILGCFSAGHGQADSRLARNQRAEQSQRDLWGYGGWLQQSSDCSDNKVTQ